MSNLGENTETKTHERSTPKGANLLRRIHRVQEHSPVERVGEFLRHPSRGVGERSTPHGSRRGLDSAQMALPGIGSCGRPSVANRRFTFDQFVVGPCNRFAYQAAWVVANGKGNAYNPLYFSGGSGLGKSHLSGAIGNHVRGLDPISRILYVTSEEFVNEMVSSIRKNDMWGFKEKYRRRCDILFIDGVQFLSGKDKTQTELSHTLDHLYNFGKQIILTGNVPPHKLSRMTDGLKSRLGCGLVVDIQPPDRETRRRILRLKAESDGVALPEEVVDLLASRICGNVRQLEGLLINLMAKSSLLFRPIDLDLAQEVMGSFQGAESHRVTIDSIQKVVAQQYHLDVEQLISRSRRKSICHPRQMAMYLSRKLTEESLDVIGRAFCRDHASVIHSIGVVERHIKEKATVRRELEFLVEKLKLTEKALSELIGSSGRR